MGKFFNSENWFWQGFGRIADYFLLSILWLVTSIPLLTLGASGIALYDTAAHCFRYGEKDMLQRYWRTFRAELRRGTGLTVLWAALALALNFFYQVIGAQAQNGGIWPTVGNIYFFLLLLPVGWIIWCIALESRFVYTLGQLMKNALLITFGHLPQTLAAAAIFAVFWNIFLNFPFFVMVLPGVMVHLQLAFTEKILQKYMPEETADSIEV